jgi:creatinine amidohydrolase
MQLQLCTWPEVEAYLSRSTGIIIPVGSTEQHGPNGLIGTDTICPETIARGVAEHIEALVAPALSIGMAQHHLEFPGSITLRPSTLLALVKDVVNSLAKHGFDRLYFLNGHGGNIATLSAAFSEIYSQTSMAATRADQPRTRCKLRNWWNSPAIQALSQELFGDAEGSHATPSEVSVTFFAYPEAVKRVEMAPPIAPQGAFYDAQDYRWRFPDGRIGSNPSLATVEAGARLYELAVEKIAEDYQAFVQSE